MNKNDPGIRLLKNDKAHQHRYNDSDTPKASSDKPTCPSNLSSRSAEIFKELVDRINEMYPASKTDLDLLVLYSNNKEQLESYELLLREQGSTFTTYTKPDGEGVCHISGVRARPEVNMLKECKALQFRILKEFGLSPASRKAVTIPKKQQPKKNSFAGFKKTKTK